MLTDIVFYMTGTPEARAFVENVKIHVLSPPQSHDFFRVRIQRFLPLLATLILFGYPLQGSRLRSQSPLLRSAEKQD